MRQRGGSWEKERHTDTDGREESGQYDCAGGGSGDAEETWWRILSRINTEASGRERREEESELPR